jgi:hypothetical protein
MRRLLLVATLLLTACPSKPDDSGASADVDLDGDGFFSLEDCDDQDPAVFPGAVERCNGVDDDCDGYVDDQDPSVDGAFEYTVDGDGDGYGALDGAIERACEDPGAGWVPADQATDCDDGDPAVHPDAQEVCNQIDDDCDGEIDEAGALDSSWYLDVDGDGYGNDEEVIEQCEQPSGYVLEGGDCDDGDPAVSPGADERCNGVDDDCDGVVDEDDAVDAPTWYADTDGDGFGGTDSTTTACEQPAGYLATSDDCDDGDPAVFPGADERCNGADDDCDGVVDEDDAVDATTWYQDADADGFGNPDATTAACSQPSGYVADATDCIDTSDVSWPGADELCDGLDNDCDGTTDEDVVDGATWYLDADGDGYGDAASSSTTAACEQPSGYVGNATDCDDGDAAVNPWADELCDGVDNDCDGTTDEDDAADAPTWYADADGDGYGDPASGATACSQPSGTTSDASDCDDADPGISPDAAELCDGVDNDCDGATDEGDAIDAPTWYADADGDGWGDAGTTTTACSQPSGYLPDTGDCHDGNPAINPDADEVCDGADNDCDGLTDEADAIDGATWYADADGDGYGDAGSSTTACSQPSGYTASPADCDDGDAGAYPGADEVCDGADNDCDGTVDEADAVDATTWYTDADGDGWGDSASSTTACAQPAGMVSAGGDCDDGDASANPGEDELCDGVDNDCDGTVDEADAVDAATWYADADGDGYGDAGSSTRACTAPAGWVADATDCDDGDASANPGEDERCDGSDNDCDGLTDEADAVDAGSWYADADGDGWGDAGRGTTACSQPSGYTASSTDCDDSDASAYPGADELCDGVDNDCDGSTDEADAVDAPTWYADADGDGYGDASASATACTAPWGHVADSTDCDDADASANPGAAEICDGVDNDCDGAVDEADAIDGTLWYADTDGDGYGDASASTFACTQPSGYVADSRDCDDSDASAYPSADEYCDGVDNDCDGAVDERTAVDVATWYRDADGDGYGGATVTTTACDQPSGYEADGSDCNDTVATINPGAAEICDSLDNDCDGLVDDADSDTTGQPSWYPDADGDGYGAAGGATTACTQPAGTVTSASDCDDGDPAVHPTATEWCNGVDDDCDGTADGVGLAAWIDSAGTVSDLTGALATGSSSTAITRSFTTDGTLVLCEGTYYLHVSDRTADLTIQGLYGSSSTFVVGDGSASVISASSSSSLLTLEGLTISGGYGSYGGGINGGSHGLDIVLDDVVIEDCASSSYGGGLYLRAGTLDATDLVLEGNQSGDYGGGAYLRSTTANIQDATISNNTAYYAGGLMVHTGDAELIDSEVTDNEAYYYGGGVYVTYGDVLLDECQVHGNIASYGSWSSSPAGGGLFLNNGAYLACVGSTSTTAGVYDNEADYGGGAFFYDDDSELDSDTCDWGSGSTDNDPDDVTLLDSWRSYTSYGSDATFSCDGSRCS